MHTFLLRVCLKNLCESTFVIRLKPVRYVISLAAFFRRHHLNTLVLQKPTLGSWVILDDSFVLLFF